MTARVRNSEFGIRNAAKPMDSAWIAADRLSFNANRVASLCGAQDAWGRMFPNSELRTPNSEFDCGGES